MLSARPGQNGAVVIDVFIYYSQIDQVTFLFAADNIIISPF